MTSGRGAVSHVLYEVTQEDDKAHTELRGTPLCPLVERALASALLPSLCRTCQPNAAALPAVRTHPPSPRPTLLPTSAALNRDSASVALPSASLACRSSSPSRTSVSRARRSAPWLSASACLARRSASWNPGTSKGQRVHHNQAAACNDGGTFLGPPQCRYQSAHLQGNIYVCSPVHMFASQQAPVLQTPTWVPHHPNPGISSPPNHQGTFCTV